ncbi:zinc finger protein 239-like [Indicator indicator]|uniref:zinc finger protein 239-like n=1 Tax=Indicator indicator TaxID=1002788 RepID=UPI0023DFB335|nr:zinc finger protein 239-like [Indicator indicator]
MAAPLFLTAAWGGSDSRDLSREDERGRLALCASPAEVAEDSYSTVWVNADPRAWAGEPLGVQPETGNPALLICGVCGRSFEAEAELRAHQEEPSHPAPSYQCSACGKAFRRYQNLLTHKKQRSWSRHACSECSRTFCLRGDLLRHRASHGGYCCALCGCRFRHQRHLLSHHQAHAAPHQCPHCADRFPDEAGLSRHGAVCPAAEQPFVCQRCGRGFSWRESLIIHLRGHAAERAHSCPDCGRSFSRRGNLVVHRRVHTGERPFACPLCSKAFANKANLITHKRLHRRYKTLGCTQCHLGFSSKSKLRLHLQMHADGMGTLVNGACQQ